ncbi:16S rRNA (guanine(966)-N(2))-methyltransferase RsmD [Lysobacteraceae bacterium NML75-0749]|nr:16S rRNA (guanine(966)-N(2))-methyltransferase RsmD [Xanthomonadaceae bacterium NML75-0749]PJK04186.1 16S rRNA (guanine(966)-N(2))-methyltransferase RsmD [Xanthomonadaceae bacterium NML91-0268]
MSKSFSPAARGHVRIIAGRWRGSRLTVADAPGLRPTSDRVRETLFNWLMPYLPGALVLDAFAGTGALGFEAASRGAAQVVLMEREPRLVQSLRQQLDRLEGAHEVVSVLPGDTLSLLPTLAQQGRTFDIAFVDPPFAENLWERVLPQLLPLMNAGAMLYVEMPQRTPAPLLPQDWQLHREMSTREVIGRLYRRD